MSQQEQVPDFIERLTDPESNNHTTADYVDRFFVKHHGTKGMRWGVRKKSSKPSSTDYKQTVPLRNRRTHELSNKQLQKVNARINLEQGYKRLNPTKVQRGSAVAKGVLAGLTTAASAYALFNSPAGKAAIASGKRMIEKLK